MSFIQTEWRKEHKFQLSVVRVGDIVVVCRVPFVVTVLSHMQCSRGCETRQLYHEQVPKHLDFFIPRFRENDFPRISVVLASHFFLVRLVRSVWRPGSVILSDRSTSSVNANCVLMSISLRKWCNRVLNFDRVKRFFDRLNTVETHNWARITKFDLPLKGQQFIFMKITSFCNNLKTSWHQILTQYLNIVQYYNSNILELKSLYRRNLAILLGKHKRLNHCAPLTSELFK